MRAGFSLIDTLIALTLFGNGMGNLVHAYYDRSERTISAKIAGTLNAISEPSKSYIERNYETLLTLVPSGGAYDIPLTGSPTWNGIGSVASTSPSLPSGWTPRLPDGEFVHLVARHIPATSYYKDYLDAALVTSGGHMSDRQTGYTASLLHGMAGSILNKTYGSAPGGLIVGTNGAWSDTASLWSSGFLLDYGHVILRLSSVNGSVSPYLSRYQGGNAEKTRMHTSIDVNTNDLNNIGSTDTQFIRNTREDDIQIQNTLSGLSLQTQTGAEKAVSMHGGINLCADNTEGCGVSLSDKSALTNGNDGWMHMQTTSPQGGLRSLENLSSAGAAGGQILRSDAVGVPGAACGSVNGTVVHEGDIGHDTAGNILICTNNVWRKEAPFQFKKTFSNYYNGTNTTSEPWFINIAGNTDGDDKSHAWTSVHLAFNGQDVCDQVGTEGDNASCQGIALPGDNWSAWTTGCCGYTNEWTTITGNRLPTEVDSTYCWKRYHSHHKQRYDWVCSTTRNFYNP